jgi:hypothetical protein
VFSREDLSDLLKINKKVAIRFRWHFGIFKDAVNGKLSNTMIQCLLPLNEEDIDAQKGANVLFAEMIGSYGMPSDSDICIYDSDVGDYLILNHDFTQRELDIAEEEFYRVHDRHHHHHHHHSVNICANDGHEACNCHEEKFNENILEVKDQAPDGDKNE